MERGEQEEEERETVELTERFWISLGITEEERGSRKRIKPSGQTDLEVEEDAGRGVASGSSKGAEGKGGGARGG